VNPKPDASTASTDEGEALLATALRQRGGRVTPQRLVIRRVVGELGRHVTAEEVHAAVSERLPNVSLPTVYSTLELLEELGEVRKVHAGGDAVLYDPRPDDHHHLVCKSCGRVEDLDAAVDAAPALRRARRTGFSAERASLVVTGLCRDCARRKR
jgi:Fe2+ or Zn2+ uptake regulation protein